MTSVAALSAIFREKKLVSIRIKATDYFHNIFRSRLSDTISFFQLQIKDIYLLIHIWYFQFLFGVWIISCLIFVIKGDRKAGVLTRQGALLGYSELSWGCSGVFRMCLGVFRACSQFYRHPKTNFEMHTTRIFAVKIRVANSEMHTTRIFVVKIRVANFEIAQLGFPRWKSELQT